MSEPLSVEAQPPPADSTPGSLLKRERERRSLSLQQAAEDLHLDTWIVEAIEANRFQALGAPVYAKGHLRKYASRLGLGEEEIIRRYESLQDRPVVSDPIPTAITDPVRPPRRSFKKPVLIVLALLAAAVSTWFGFQLMSRRNTGDVVESPRVEPSVPPSPQTSLAPQEQAPATSVESPPSAASEASVTTPATAAQTPPAATSGTQAQLRLEFSGESWAEIYDAQGARLLYAMGAPGRVRTVTGTAPLQVTFGAASAVSMEVNGQPAVIPRLEGREASKFVIDADGNLR